MKGCDQGETFINRTLNFYILQSCVASLITMGNSVPSKDRDLTLFLLKNK